MDRVKFKNAVNLARLLAEQILSPGDVAVDATCGRGRDTLFLAGRVGEAGKVYAFDIQEEAISSTRTLLAENSCSRPVILLQVNHALMGKYIRENPAVVMFNLGYLPGGDHAIHTRGDSTIAALREALELLLPEGMMTVVCYPGFPAGEEETREVVQFLAALPQQQYEVSRTCFINQVNQPPQLLVVRKHGREA